MFKFDSQFGVSLPGSSMPCEATSVVNINPYFKTIRELVGIQGVRLAIDDRRALHHIFVEEAYKFPKPGILTRLLSVLVGHGEQGSHLIFSLTAIAQQVKVADHSIIQVYWSSKATLIVVSGRSW